MRFQSVAAIAILCSSQLRRTSGLVELHDVPIDGHELHLVLPKSLKRLSIVGCGLRRLSLELADGSPLASSAITQVDLHSNAFMAIPNFFYSMPSGIVNLDIRLNALRRIDVSAPQEATLAQWMKAGVLHDGVSERDSSVQTVVVVSLSCGALIALTVGLFVVRRLRTQQRASMSPSDTIEKPLRPLGSLGSIWTSSRSQEVEHFASRRNQGRESALTECSMATPPPDLRFKGGSCVVRGSSSSAATPTRVSDLAASQKDSYADFRSPSELSLLARGFTMSKSLQSLTGVGACSGDDDGDNSVDDRGGARKKLRAMLSVLLEGESPSVTINGKAYECFGTLDETQYSFIVKCRPTSDAATTLWFKVFVEHDAIYAAKELRVLQLLQREERCAAYVPQLVDSQTHKMLRGVKCSVLITEMGTSTSFLHVVRGHVDRASQHATRFKGDLPSYSLASLEFVPPEMARNALCGGFFDGAEGSISAEPLGASYAFDIWSLGVLILKMYASGKHLDEFSGCDTPADVLRRLAQPDFHFERSIGLYVLHDDVKDLVRQCLQREPSYRPRVDAVLRHPAFQGYEHERTLQCAPPRAATGAAQAGDGGGAKVAESSPPSLWLFLPPEEIGLDRCLSVDDWVAHMQQLLQKRKPGDAELAFPLLFLCETTSGLQRPCQSVGVYKSRVSAPQSLLSLIVPLVQETTVLLEARALLSGLDIGAVSGLGKRHWAELTNFYRALEKMLLAPASSFTQTLLAPLQELLAGGERVNAQQVLDEVVCLAFSLEKREHIQSLLDIVAATGSDCSKLHGQSGRDWAALRKCEVEDATRWLCRDHVP
ncbi:hypothetical protein PybrP1_009650 [[Pythium] brassicae (nom. inval.)]|nr:hypothetical protein PybrP1_009650 [[Pythium] brassicae (nom. inval.)]